MTRAIIGFDTELSAGLYQRGANDDRLRAPHPRRMAEQSTETLAHEVRSVRDLIAMTVNSSRWGKIAGGVILAMA